jgi:hypothetical protein
MPRKNVIGEFKFKGFVVCDLVSTDIDKVMSLASDAEALWDGTLAFVSEFYKISIGFADTEGNVKVVVSDIKESRSSFGWSLTGEGPTAMVALASCIYKHTFMMGRNWEPFCKERETVARIR